MFAAALGPACRWLAKQEQRLRGSWPGAQGSEQEKQQKGLADMLIKAKQNSEEEAKAAAQQQQPPAAQPSAPQAQADTQEALAEVGHRGLRLAQHDHA